MQDLGLTAEERRAYEHALISSGHQWWQAYFWHRDRTHAATIELFQDGQVNLDCTQALTDDGNTGSMWSATLTVADPENRFHLDSNVLFLDRILRLEHWTFVPNIGDAGKAVGCPVFTGPITKCDDTGLGVLAIEAMGMEVWGRGQIKTTKTYPKGSLVTDAIRDIWHNLIGDSLFWLDVPDMKHKLPSDFQVGPATVDGGWGAIQYLAPTIGCDAFYDGASRGTLRDSSTAIVYEYDGDQAVIGPAPQESTLLGGVGGSAADALPIVNDYIVIGQGKPTQPGGKPPVIRGEAIAPQGNRFWPQSLGHPDGPGLFLTETANLDHIRLQKTADQISALRLKRRLQVAEQATFNSVVVPHLDPFDPYRVKTSGFGRQAENMIRSIPLRWSPSSPQTNGYTARVSVPPQRMRR